MFRFTVDFYDEETHGPNTDKGIVGTSTYGAAADRLVEYYGKENIVSISLYEIEEVVIDDEILEMIDEDVSFKVPMN